MAYTTIDDPTAYFQTKLYTGTGSSLALTNDGNSDLQPDWVWIKCRDDSHNHQVFDSVRGVHKRMRTDTSGAETESSESLKSFNTDGFTLGTQANVNNSSNTFVAWNWKESATAGFDIVSYTGNDTARTISHSLSAVPKMMIVKCRNVGKEWTIFHASLGNGKFIELDNGSAVQTATNRWNDTSPTSSVFTVGVDSSVNGDTQTYIAYLFSEKKGFSKMGSYVGNGNANGSFIFTGFKPSWIMGKKSSGSNNWYMFDTTRNPFNLTTKKLRADTSDTEDDNTSKAIDILSNGYKIKTADEEFNDSGETYIFMAFAENPFVTSGGVPATAR